MSTKDDPNQVAARVARETAARNDQSLPADIETAWQAWIAGVGRVDERTKALLRAAFEFGVTACGGKNLF